MKLKFGMILFTGFEVLDVFGPLDAFNDLSFANPNISLSLIANTVDRVSSSSPARNSSWPEFHQWVLPTHTFANPPPDLDVLFVPGGPGVRQDANIKPAIKFVKKVYPKLKYLISICTGAHIVASTGLLDGRNATTNKQAFKEIAKRHPGVKWVSHARWVEDGNIWSSSGVSAGMDAALAWIASIYGEGTATNLTNGMEYERHTNASWDPFAALNGL